jgi:transcriptional regulator with XRE-family HTH domain
MKLDGTKLKNARLDKGWSQNEAAVAATVSEPTYIRAEQGLPIHPSTGRLITEALGVALADVRISVEDDEERTA